MSEEVRAELRKDFLKILKTFEGKEAKLELCQGTVNENCTIVAFDREILQTVVSPFVAPNKETLRSAIIRLTDVESISVKCQAEK